MGPRSSCVAGIIAGLGAAALWALVAYLTHYAFSCGALGLGTLVGLAVRKAAGAFTSPAIIALYRSTL
jgi:hypothetical protein